MLEAEIMKSVEKTLWNLQITGEVVFYLRMNSGTIRTNIGTWVKLAAKGTPDWLVIVRGQDHKLILLFVECKSSTGKLRPEQEDFRFKYSKVKDVYFVVVNDLKILPAFINEIAINRVDELPSEL